MENILPLIPAWIMLTIGFALLGLELVMGTFVVIFFGLAFIIIGAAGFFIEWSAGEIQLLLVMLLGGVLTFGLRGFLMKGMDKEDLPLETMQVGDTGLIVAHGGDLRVMYKGTTWTFKNNGENDVAEDDEVTILELKNNVAYIKK